MEGKGWVRSPSKSPQKGRLIKHTKPEGQSVCLSGNFNHFVNTLKVRAVQWMAFPLGRSGWAVNIYFLSPVRIFQLPVLQPWPKPGDY